MKKSVMGRHISPPRDERREKKQPLRPANRPARLRTTRYRLRALRSDVLVWGKETPWIRERVASGKGLFMGRSPTYVVCHMRPLLHRGSSDAFIQRFSFNNFAYNWSIIFIIASAL